jgi:hypothetical protein
MTNRDLLRHAVATVAYRGGKAVRGVPQGFATYSLGDGSRSAAQILAHVGDLFDWALNLARGTPSWTDSAPLEWGAEVQRFHAVLQRFDDFLAGGTPLAVAEEQLFQGPVADALTHVGQLNMMRRRFGAPVKGENYLKAAIVAGRVGADQVPARREFD